MGSSSGGDGSEAVTLNGVTLHPDYHRVKDSLEARGHDPATASDSGHHPYMDPDPDNDPNYESVDEAFAKVATPPPLSRAPGAAGRAGQGSSRLSSSSSPATNASISASVSAAISRSLGAGGAVRTSAFIGGTQGMSIS